jgi:hypothetical protein
LGAQNLTLSNASSTFSGVIGGTGGLGVSGGTETLTGTNTFTGATTIGSGATLALTDDTTVTYILSAGNLGWIGDAGQVAGDAVF